VTQHGTAGGGKSPSTDTPLETVGAVPSVSSRQGETARVAPTDAQPLLAGSACSYDWLAAPSSGRSALRAAGAAGCDAAATACMPHWFSSHRTGYGRNSYYTYCYT